MTIKELNKIVTGNYYIRNGVMYIEVKRSSRGTQYAIPMVTYKYISEERIHG